eukprot:scaffold21818_cov28-Tisochrysis_lutea.AAC.1
MRDSVSNVIAGAFTMGEMRVAGSSSKCASRGSIRAVRSNGCARLVVTLRSSASASASDMVSASCSAAKSASNGSSGACSRRNRSGGELGSHMYEAKGAHRSRLCRMVQGLSSKPASSAFATGPSSASAAPSSTSRALDCKILAALAPTIAGGVMAARALPFPSPDLPGQPSCLAECAAASSGRYSAGSVVSCREAPVSAFHEEGGEGHSLRGMRSSGASRSSGQKVREPEAILRRPSSRRHVSGRYTSRETARSSRYRSPYERSRREKRGRPERDAIALSWRERERGRERGGERGMRESWLPARKSAREEIGQRGQRGKRDLLVPFHGTWPPEERELRREKEMTGERASIRESENKRERERGTRVGRCPEVHVFTAHIEVFHGRLFALLGRE